MKFNKKYLNPVILFKKIICKLDDNSIINLSDSKKIQLMYEIGMNKKLNLDNPKTFNEKLQWLKIHDRNPNYTKMVDKYEVKKYVSSIIGEEYIIPTLGIYDKFDEIKFDELPNQFVIKCTHDSGGLVIVKDKNKLDINAAKKKINKCLLVNYYKVNREWPYKNVKPRIIIEKYMEDNKTNDIQDYKFFCFDGVCKFMFIATNRQASTETCFDFFDVDYNHLPFTNGHPNANTIPEKPKHFDEMIKLSEKLSKNIPQVRIDWYEINNKIYFGEITFCHWAGMVPFNPEIWDEKFGKYIDITKVGEKNNE